MTNISLFSDAILFTLQGSDLCSVLSVSNCFQMISMYQQQEYCVLAKSLIIFDRDSKLILSPTALFSWDHVWVEESSLNGHHWIKLD